MQKILSVLITTCSIISIAAADTQMLPSSQQGDLSFEDQELKPKVEEYVKKLDQLDISNPKSPENQKFITELVSLLTPPPTPRLHAFASTGFTSLKDKSQRDTITRVSARTGTIGFHYAPPRITKDSLGPSIGLTINYANSTSHVRQLTPLANGGATTPDERRTNLTKVRANNIMFVPNVSYTGNFYSLNLFFGFGGGSNSIRALRTAGSQGLPPNPANPPSFVEAVKGRQDTMQVTYGINTGFSIPINWRTKIGLTAGYSEVRSSSYEYTDSREVLIAEYNPGMAGRPVTHPTSNMHVNTIRLGASLDYRLAKHLTFDAGLGMGYDTKRRQTILPPLPSTGQLNAILPGFAAESPTSRLTNKLTTNHSLGISMGGKSKYKFTIKYRGDRRGNKLRGKTLMFGFRYSI